MQIVFIVGLILLLVVYMTGILLCAITLSGMDVPLTPLAVAITFIPILHWYYVLKYLAGGVHNWLKDFKEAINEYKELD